MVEDVETRYSTIEKELLAILFGVENFRPYLYGHKFTLVTDHRPLVWLHNVKNPGSRLVRWSLRLKEYDYTIMYKPGRINANADALSRNPVDNEKESEVKDTEAGTRDPDNIDLSSNDSITDETFNLRDREQILAIDGTVSAPDFDLEVNLQDDDFSCNNKLISEAFDLFCTDTNYNDRDSTNDTDVNEFSPTWLQALPIDNIRTPCRREKTNKDLGSPTWLQTLPIDDIRTSCRREKTDEVSPTWLQVLPVDDTRTPCRRETNSENSGNVQVPGNDKDLLMGQVITDKDERDKRKETTGSGDYLTEFQRRKIQKDSGNQSSQLTVPVLVLNASCIKYVKEPYLTENRHLMHFVSKDCMFTTEVSRNLRDEGKVDFEALLSTQPQLGHCVVFEQDERYIFHLVTKSTYDEKPSAEIVKQCLKGLKIAMTDLKINCCNMSRKGNGLDRLHWSRIETALKETFSDTEITIYVCSNELLVPDFEDRQKIIKECHSSVIGGHSGIAKTYARLRKRFFWESSKQDVQEFIKTCESCQRKKLVRKKGKEPMKITDTPRKAFDKIQIDIVGPLPTTEQGNRYILTVQDCLTKYSDAIPLKTIDSVTVACALAENVICRFGCPRIIHSDQGSNFLSQIMRSFCQIFKIQQIKSTAFHPQSLGALERSHHVFVEYLRHYCKNHSWDKWLKFAMFSFNSTVHSATKFTPHRLVFGEDPRIPSEFETGEVAITYNEYLDNLLFKIYEAQSTARENIKQAKLKYKFYYDRKSNIEDYKIGEYVYLLKEPRTSKLDDHYEGPYKVANVFTDHNVEIETSENRKKIVHKNKLKLAHLRANLEVLE